MKVDFQKVCAASMLLVGALGGKDKGKDKDRDDGLSCERGAPSDYFDDIAIFNIERKLYGNSTTFIDSNCVDYCDEEFFAMDGRDMVLISSGLYSDRAELKMPKAYNFYLNNSQEMSFTATVEDVPVDVDNTHRGVTIAQIHNREDRSERPLARMDIAGFDEMVRITFSSGYGKSDGQESYDLVEFTDGDEIKVKMSVLEPFNGTQSVEAYVENKSKKLKNSIVYVIEEGNNWQELDGFYYFKAGVYQQAEGTNPKITIDKFKVEL